MSAAIFSGGCAQGGDRRGPPIADAGGTGTDGGATEDGGAAEDASSIDGGSTPCTTNAECDDADACNGVETCGASGTCEAGTAVSCDDALACTADSCDATTGACAHTPDDGVCSAGEVCDAVEGCLVPPPCLVDADCDDGLYCTGVESCDPAVGCRTTPLSCDDAIACTMDMCDEAADTCAHVAVDAICNDGLGCNGVETCAASTGCVAGTAMTCNDGVACTADSCVEPGSCRNVGTDADGDGYLVAGCLGGNDCNDAVASIHPGAVELCDGIDNDCVGGIDNGSGMTCALGSAPASCTTACGTSGTAPCTAACTRATCLAATETCGNACDDNGNGMIDEGCAPPNDLCGGAVVLSGTGSRAGTLIGATAQTTDCGTGVEVFYRVTVSTPSIVYLSTVGGATFDTRLSYRGTSCAGTSAQCVDDSCASLQSHLAQRVAAGTHYFAVHTFSSFTTPGAFTLSHRVISTTSGAAVHVPDDDLPAVGTFQTYTGSIGASGSLAPTSCGSSFVGTSGETVYYFAQCPADSRAYTATTCTGTSYDSALWARFNGSEIACNDDSCGLQSTLTTPTVVGAGVVEVFVDGYNGASGAYQLGLTL